VETIKWAEDEDALIVRAYEADGGAGTATLRLGVVPRSVDEVDLLERNPRGLAFDASSTVSLDLRAHEVKTLRIAPR
jgi:alpha-mannosidase